MNSHKTLFSSFIFLLISLLLLSHGVTAKHGLPEFTELVKKNAPAVVNISTTQRTKGRTGMPDMQLPENSPLHELFKHFLEEGGRGGESTEHHAQSLGSGFILSEDGFILTNNHVVKDADQIIVRLSNRKSYEATVVGLDEATDVALLKIEANNLPIVTMGKSSNVKVGEWVLAIGSPFGFDHSVTAGIVSAKGRSLPTENYVPYIQTDVAINPGNSGGPLFNLDGEVIGINSQIYSRTGGFMGLSFAIPIDLALDVVDQLQKTGHVSRGYLGVLIQDVTHNLAESFGMSHPMGALVSRVLDDSPAAAAGLKAGDVILSYDGKPLTSSSQLPPMVGATAINTKVPLAILRNKEEINISLVVGTLPGEKVVTVMPIVPESDKADRLGLVVSELPGSVKAKSNIFSDAGVLVRIVNPGSAKQGGIRKGDIILMLDGEKMKSAASYLEHLNELPAGKNVAILVHREEGPIFIALKLPE